MFVKCLKQQQKGNEPKVRYDDQVPVRHQYMQIYTNETLNDQQN